MSAGEENIHFDVATNELSIRRGTLPDKIGPWRGRTSAVRPRDLTRFLNHLNFVPADTMIQVNEDIESDLFLKFEAIDDPREPVTFYVKSMTGPSRIAMQFLNEALDTEFSTNDLKKIVRKYAHLMSTSAFDSLMSTLNKARIEQNRVVAEENDNRGNIDLGVKSVLRSDAIGSITMDIELVVGEPKVSIDIDVCHDIQGNRIVWWLECWQINRELVALLQNMRSEVSRELTDKGFTVVQSADLGGSIGSSGAAKRLIEF